MTTPIETIMNRVMMTPTNCEPSTDGTPWATHEGILWLGQHPLRVVRLNTGERVLNADDVVSMFRAWGGKA